VVDFTGAKQSVLPGLLGKVRSGDIRADFSHGKIGVRLGEIHELHVFFR